MARLGKLVKTLKIGIGTATDFLKSKGFTVEEDFNTKITGEQEALLLKEFATPEMLAELGDQKKESKKAKLEDNKVEKQIVEPQKSQIKVESEKPQVKVVAKIDLDAINKPKEDKKEEPKKEVKAEPIKVEKSNVESQKVDVKKEEPKQEVAPVASEPKQEVKKEEQKSQKVAEERRARRNHYFERTVANDTELELVVSKVEALLWIDRLIYHYWRATARMAELKNMKEI